MDQDIQSRKALAGWKQIASYLDVSEPTARKYHEEDNLPVYRLRRRYYAYAEELDSWLRQQRLSSDEVGKPTSRIRWAVVILTTIILSAVVLILGRAFPSPGPPVSVRTEGAVLTALDQAGRVVWRRDTKDFLPSAAAIREGHYLVEDFDADGRNEVAVTVLSSEPRAETSKLICLDDDGTLLWTFVNGRELTVRGRYFEPYYQGRAQWLETSRGSFILNVAAHVPWYPTQVALLDPRTGIPVLEYWHPGRISATELCDLDEDGEEELYLGGGNNPGFGTGHPSLAVLRLPRPGEDIQVRDTFFRQANPQESKYILLPRYDVFEVQEVGASVLLAECQEAGRLMIAVGQSLLTVVYIYLNADLEVEDIRPAEGLIQLHKKLYVEGFLDHPYHPQELEEWRKVVKFSTLPDGNSPEVQALFR